MIATGTSPLSDLNKVFSQKIPPLTTDLADHIIAFFQKMDLSSDRDSSLYKTITDYTFNIAIQCGTIEKCRSAFSNWLAGKGFVSDAHRILRKLDKDTLIEKLNRLTTQCNNTSFDNRVALNLTPEERTIIKSLLSDKSIFIDNSSDSFAKIRMESSIEALEYAFQDIPSISPHNLCTTLSKSPLERFYAGLFNEEVRHIEKRLNSLNAMRLRETLKHLKSLAPEIQLKVIPIILQEIDYMSKLSPLEKTELYEEFSKQLSDSNNSKYCLSKKPIPSFDNLKTLNPITSKIADSVEELLYFMRLEKNSEKDFLTTQPTFLETQNQFQRTPVWSLSQRCTSAFYNFCRGKGFISSYERIQQTIQKDENFTAARDKLLLSRDTTRNTAISQFQEETKLEDWKNTSQRMQIHYKKIIQHTRKKLENQPVPHLKLSLKYNLKSRLKDLKIFLDIPTMDFQTIKDELTKSTQEKTKEAFFNLFSGKGACSNAQHALRSLNYFWVRNFIKIELTDADILNIYQEIRYMHKLTDREKTELKKALADRLQPPQ